MYFPFTLPESISCRNSFCLPFSSSSDAKAIGVRLTKTHSKHTEDVSQLNVLESQSWLSTQYGDPVEFYDVVTDAKQEEHYNVVVTGDAPQIYQVSVSETP